MSKQDNPTRKPQAPTDDASLPVRDTNPFDDVEALRLSPDATTVAVRRVITRVPVRKPGNQEFFRAHPDERYRIDTGIIDLRDDRESYLIHPQLREELADEIRAVRLYTCISRAGAVFLWAVPLPGTGRSAEWLARQRPRRRGAGHDAVDAHQGGHERRPVRYLGGCGSRFPTRSGRSWLSTSCSGSRSRTPSSTASTILWCSGCAACGDRQASIACHIERSGRSTSNSGPPTANAPTRSAWSRGS